MDDSQRIAELEAQVRALIAIAWAVADKELPKNRWDEMLAHCPDDASRRLIAQWIVPRPTGMEGFGVVN